mmetsp:Transcript_4800/g.8830  ORF Transcript_4800/g.8830 Transcript_4800/m.8830 type:complete len:233 (-) Transcript_4800:643-1341(-)
MNVTKSQLGVVVDIDIQNLSSLVKTLRETLVANVLDVGNVGPTYKLLQLSQVVGLGISVNELGIEKILLQRLSGHLEVWNELGPNLGLVRCIANQNVLAGVFGIDVTLDSVGGESFFELGLSKPGPHGFFVALNSIRLGTIKILHEIDKHANGKNLHLNLLLLILCKLGSGELDVDRVSLFVQHVVLRHTDKSNILCIKVVQLINVSSNTSRVGTDRSKDEKILEILVIRKV